MTSPKKVICQECKKEFNSDSALHKHLKAHNLTVAEYYTKFFPRKNALTQELLPFKNKADYFNQDFTTRAQMIKWCEQCKEKDLVKEYILKQLRLRIEKNKYKYAPNHIEIEINKLPPIDIYKRNFGGYGQACKELGLEPLYSKGVNKNLLEKSSKIESIEIHIDTREQQPLSFKRSRSHKLDFGDYTMSGKNYTYTYVDRKSESDFKGTMGAGFKRFTKELQRAKDFNAYLYIVVEKSIEQIAKNNFYLKRNKMKGAVNMDYIWHNMRVLAHDFKGNCQFVFSGSRRNSELLIPNLLHYGSQLWNVDIQYLLDSYDLD